MELCLSPKRHRCLYAETRTAAMEQQLHRCVAGLAVRLSSSIWCSCNQRSGRTRLGRRVSSALLSVSWCWSPILFTYCSLFHSQREAMKSCEVCRHSACGTTVNMQPPPAWIWFHSIRHWNRDSTRPVLIHHACVVILTFVYLVKWPWSTGKDNRATRYEAATQISSVCASGYHTHTHSHTPPAAAAASLSNRQNLTADDKQTAIIMCVDHGGALKKRWLACQCWWWI